MENLQTDNKKRKKRDEQGSERQEREGNTSERKRGTSSWFSRYNVEQTKMRLEIMV
jgi:hypothetical protein